MTATFLETAPAEAFGPSQRIRPIRKREGFVPTVQRWSFLLPPDCVQMRVAFLAVQGTHDAAIERSAFMAWLPAALDAHTHGPATVDHARFTDSAGLRNHVVAAYWVDDARFARWRDSVEPWWSDPARQVGETGVWRELLRVPRDRQESIYWRDYPAGLMTSSEVAVFPTPYCGYYGAMRDRITAAGSDPLDCPRDAALVAHDERRGFGERWRITPPANFAVIRSANTWGRMDAEQLADYREKLRVPLERGMDYLRQNAAPSGCASLRMLGKCDAAGASFPEDHALGYFLSLAHMERWAEDHQTHAAIFGAAMARYKRYGVANQLRTWHEVYILPVGEQCFEYANCHPSTGLLRWFDGVRVP